MRERPPLLAGDLRIRVRKEVSPSEFGQSHLPRVQSETAQSERFNSRFVSTSENQPRILTTIDDKIPHTIRAPAEQLTQPIPFIAPETYQTDSGFSFPQSDFRPAQKPVDSPAWDKQIETT